MIAGAFQAIGSDRKASETLDRKHKRQRKALGERVNRQTRSTLKEINKDHADDRQALITQQHQERRATKEAHRLQSQKAARDIASGEARADFDRKNRYRVFRDIQKHKREQDAKARREAKEAKPKREFRVFRDAKAEREAATRDRAGREKEKDTKAKGTYRAFRDMKEEGRDKGRDTDRGRDTDKGRDRERGRD